MLRSKLNHVSTRGRFSQSISDFTPHNNACDYLSMLRLKLNHLLQHPSIQITRNCICLIISFTYIWSIGHKAAQVNTLNERD